MNLYTSHRFLGASIKTWYFFRFKTVGIKGSQTEYWTNSFKMNFKIITLLVIVGVLVALAEAENPSKLQQIIEIFRYKFIKDKRNSTFKNLKKSYFYL